ncbi:hypothetical protein TcWFU_006907 [Taenia crassiceps]|uniref:Uncharacterized protein n=1 Tax=Taenia crassiceps TaxID=6207 RepID=A0ABR4QBK7_9CEST
MANECTTKPTRQQCAILRINAPFPQDLTFLVHRVNCPRSHLPYSVDLSPATEQQSLVCSPHSLSHFLLHSRPPRCLQLVLFLTAVTTSTTEETLQEPGAERECEREAEEEEVAVSCKAVKCFGSKRSIICHCVEEVCIETEVSSSLMPPSSCWLPHSSSYEAQSVRRHGHIEHDELGSNAEAGVEAGDFSATEQPSYSQLEDLSVFDTASTMSLVLCTADCHVCTSWGIDRWESFRSVRNLPPDLHFPGRVELEPASNITVGNFSVRTVRPLTSSSPPTPPNSSALTAFSLFCQAVASSQFRFAYHRCAFPVPKKGLTTRQAVKPVKYICCVGALSNALPHFHALNKAVVTLEQKPPSSNRLRFDSRQLDRQGSRR